jgi:hypothetical protein
MEAPQNVKWADARRNPATESFGEYFITIFPKFLRACCLGVQMVESAEGLVIHAALQLSFENICHDNDV